METPPDYGTGTHGLCVSIQKVFLQRKSRRQSHILSETDPFRALATSVVSNLVATDNFQIPAVVSRETSPHQNQVRLARVPLRSHHLVRLAVHAQVVVNGFGSEDSLEELYSRVVGEPPRSEHSPDRSEM